MLYTLRELECRDVINLCDGRFLGKVSDLELEAECGKITAIYIATGGFWNAAKEEIRIPWDDIKCFGEDAILVEYRRECGCGGKRTRKNGWFVI